MTSSWQDLVNVNLVGTKKVSKAAICGLDGQIWAKSDNFNLTDQEAQTAARGFNNRDGLLASGMKLENDKYFVLQADEERVIGKKESKGFFMYKTNQCRLVFEDTSVYFIRGDSGVAVIIATYKEGIQPEECSKMSGALADYFKSIGY